MGEHAAEMRRRTQRTADVRAEFERHKAGGKGRRRTARRAARAAREIPWIVGRTVDFVIALPVAEVYRHVGFTEDDRTRRLEPLHRQCIGIWLPTLEFREAPGGRQARDVELLLDRHRQTEQRPPLTAPECC